MNQLFQQAFSRPVAILPAKLQAITDLLYRHHHGQAVDRLSVAVAVEKEDPPGPLIVDSYTGVELAAGEPRDTKTEARYIAVHPLYGVLMQHAGIMTEYSGGTSLQEWSREFRRLDSDPTVGWIVIDTHSPGGSVYLVEETSDLIFGARQAGRTKILQVANSMAASAAVWVGSAAGEVVVTPGGEYGSIGVISQYVDYSEFNQKAGIKPTYVRTPANKARFTGDEPLTEEMLATLVERNEDVYGRFVKAVARNRGVSQQKVREDFGQGGMMTPGAAQKAGLIDRVASLQEVLDDLVSKKKRVRAAGVRLARQKLVEVE